MNNRGLSDMISSMHSELSILFALFIYLYGLIMAIIFLIETMAGYLKL